MADRRKSRTPDFNDLDIKTPSQLENTWKRETLQKTFLSNGFKTVSELFTVVEALKNNQELASIFPQMTIATIFGTLQDMFWAFDQAKKKNEDLDIEQWLLEYQERIIVSTAEKPIIR